MVGPRDRPDPFAYAQSTPGIVWMSQNTNSLPTSPKVAEAVAQAMRDGLHHLYPPNAGIPGLRELVRADLGAPADFKIKFHPGTSEGHYVLHRALWNKGDEIVTTDPSFMAIHKMMALWGAKPVEVPIYQEPYKLTVDALQDAITSKTRGLLLIDPINPLGTGYDRDEVKAFADVCEEKDLWLMHDVAYKDFSEGHTLATEFYPERTIVNYTFSKSIGLAGMRMGATVAPAEVIDAMTPWDPTILGINVLAQVAGKAALETKKEWLPGMLKTTRRNRDAIKEVVDGIDGAFIPGHPSRANMLLIDIEATSARPDDLQAELLFEHQVFVRSGNYVSPRFGERFVRVSFTVPEVECDRFCDAFPKVMAALS